MPSFIVALPQDFMGLSFVEASVARVPIPIVADQATATGMRRRGGASVPRAYSSSRHASTVTVPHPAQAEEAGKALPSDYEYLDYRGFLRDHFAAIKRLKKQCRGCACPPSRA